MPTDLRLLRVSPSAGVFGRRSHGAQPARLASGPEVGQSSVLTAGGIFGAPRLGPAAIDRHRVVGLAVPYGGEVSLPAGVTADGLRKRFRFASGAFRESLAEIRAGLRSVALLREHEPERQLGTTADGTLALEETSQGLRVGIDTRRAGGAIVAHILRDGRRWNLSAGFVALDSTRTRLADGTVLFDVERAALTEISTVRHGAFAGTYLLRL